MMKRFVSVIFAVIFSIAALVPCLIANAIDSKPSALTIIMKFGDVTLSGINLAVCRVADAKETKNGDITFDITQEFSASKVDFTNLTKEKNLALAADLNAFAVAKNITRSSKITDNDGKASFSNLAAGLYLVAQLDNEKSQYIIAPYLVMVPTLNEETGEWNRDVTVYPKTEPLKKSAKPISISVYKIWEGSGSHPKSVLVQLFKDGRVHGNTIELNSGNLWKYTWENLDSTSKWTVDEVNVPEGYVRTITGSISAGFVITNKKTTQSDSSKPDPDNPNTGDDSNLNLWIMLFVSSFAGSVVTVCAGNERKYKVK